MKKRKLDARFYKGSQSWEYDAYWEADGEKLFIHIDRDSYDSQSSATISIYSGATKSWNSLASIPYNRLQVTKRTGPHMGMEVVSYVTELSEESADLFYKDEEELLRLASLVLVKTSIELPQGYFPSREIEILADPLRRINAIIKTEFPGITYEEMENIVNEAVTYVMRGIEDTFDES